MVQEGQNQAKIRAMAALMGVELWRNNVGSFTDQRGVPVRFGLANDSKGMNRLVKSADLIGITPTLITAEMVGRTLGVFTSIEVKKSDWRYRATPREQAQLKWQEIVKKAGGIAGFANDLESALKVIKCLN